MRTVCSLLYLVILVIIVIDGFVETFEYAYVPYGRTEGEAVLLDYIAL